MTFMKAALNHCGKNKTEKHMNKNRYIFTFIVVLASFGVFTHGAYASEMFSTKTYDRVEKRNLWNAGKNITGIMMDSTSISYAELYGSYKAGGFRQHNEALSGWSAGAITKAIVHMDRISMKGSFAFDHFQGREMSGSMFINPGYYPIDALEYTPGGKTKQTYSFDGGLAYELNSEWRLGVSFDFLSANYAKRKDLRHTNYKLDLMFCPSFMFHRGNLALGGNLLVGTNSEVVQPEVVGTKITDFDAFLDKGLRYGMEEGWDGAGLHLDEPGIKGLPLRELGLGFAGQVAWKGLYADLKYIYSWGKAGEKDFIWFRFPSHKFGAKLGYKLYDKGNWHFFRLGFDFVGLVNNEYIIEKESIGGVINAITIGSNQIYERRLYAWTPEYELLRRGWRVKWNGDFSILNEISAQKYPYLITGNLLDFGTSLEGTVDVWLLELGLKLAYKQGIYNEESKTLIPAEIGTEPTKIDSYSNHWVDYVCSPKTSVDFSVKYSFYKGLYLKAEAHYTRAFNLNYILSPNRWGIALRFGYDF